MTELIHPKGKTRLQLKFATFCFVGAGALSRVFAADPMPVTVDNFVRAESDLYVEHPFRDAGAVEKFYRYRTAMPIEKQVVIRANRDALICASTHLV